MKRYFVTWMTCLANFVLYCMRMNINIAITEMVSKENTTEITNSDKSDVDPRNSIATFEWDEMTQQTILGAFYYGYAVMPILGGWLARRKGGKRVMVFVVLWTSLLTALIPWAAGVSSGLLIILRILDGLGQGISLPACYVILGKWTVPDERTTTISICFSGMAIGTIVSSYVSGWLSSAYELGGWPVSFYVYSTFGLVWTIIWATVVYENPEEDPWISETEGEYLKSFQTKVEVATENTLFPWRDIFTSFAVWAIIIGYFSYAFTYFLILTEAPTFMYTILGVDVKKTGFLLSIPSIVRFPIMLLSAVCADYIIHRRCLNVVNTRKLFVILNIGVSGVCFVILAYAGDNIVTFVILLTIAFSALGLNAASVVPNPMDISTSFSGIIAGMMVTTGACAGFIGPIILALLIENENTFEQWSLMFMITAGIQFFGMVFFLIFAKGEKQEWSEIGARQNEEMRPLNK